jgi:hypothetical protein
VYVAVDKSQTENPEADDSNPPPDGKQDDQTQCFLKSQVPRANQETGSWCWAASTQLIVEYLTKIPTRQCALVGEVFHERLKARPETFQDCCDYQNLAASLSAQIPENLANICDQGGWPESALVRQNIQFNKRDQTQGLLKWTSLTHEICEDRPFIFVVRWNSGGRHSAVGGGYQTTQHFGNFVEVYDHSPDEFYVMPLREFQGGGNFIHEFDYIGLRRGD